MSTKEGDPLNHVKWAAWGVIDIERLERMQRRNYIKRARAELASKGFELKCGGSKGVPFYALAEASTPMETTAFGGKGHTAAGADAFKKICARAVSMLEPDAHS